MSWLFSRALAEASLRPGSSAGEPSALSNSTSTPDMFSWPGKTTDALSRSRSGMTSETLPAAHGEALLTSFLGASRARTSLVRAKERDSTAPNPVSGEKWHESSARSNRPTFALRTHQLSLLEDSGPSCQRLPNSGMMRDGVCFPLPELEPRTVAKDAGFWPTPTVCGNYNRKGASAQSGDGLVTAVKRRLSTPTASDARRCDLRNSEVGGKLNPTWVEWLMGWPLGWTALEPLATDRFQRWLREHGGRCD